MNNQAALTAIATIEDQLKELKKQFDFRDSYSTEKGTISAEDLRRYSRGETVELTRQMFSSRVFTVLTQGGVKTLNQFMQIKNFERVHGIGEYLSCECDLAWHQIQRHLDGKTRVGVVPGT